MYGMLWSADSLVDGAHFSLSLLRIVYPASWVSTSTEAISSGLPIPLLAWSAAQMALWAWYSAGKYLM